MNGREKGCKKKRNCGRTDGERRKKMIDKHFKLLTMPRNHFILQKIKTLLKQFQKFKFQISEPVRKF